MTVSIKNPGALALYLAKHVSTTPVNDVGCIAIDTLTPEEWAVIINALQGGSHDEARQTPDPAPTAREGGAPVRQGAGEEARQEGRRWVDIDWSEG